MKRLLAIALCVAALAAPARAQPQTTTIPVDLLNRVYAFLQNGGSYVEAQGLREALLANAQAPAREAEIQRRIDAAVADALKAAAEKSAAPQGD